jgi:uncharacterized protein (DUF427 family)
MKAIWQGTVIAESDDTVVVEGNHYFPAESVNTQYLTDSPSNTSCPWKGTASYKHVTVDGQLNSDAAWCYPEPKEAAAEIKGRYAFWKGVQVTA